MIINWLEQDVTIPVGQTLAYDCAPGTNIVRIVNRVATGGGNVFADTRDGVAASKYLAKVQQGTTGAIVKVAELKTVYLVSDAAAHLRVTIEEINTDNLEILYNAAQIVDVQGQITVVQPVQVAGTVAVSGEVEMKNDSGNPVAVSVATALPAGTNNIGDVDVLTMPAATRGTIWNAAAVAIAGTSQSLAIGAYSLVSFFGNTSAATNFTIQYSDDNATFYDSDQTINVAAPGNFAKTIETGARYVRLKSSAAATITAICSAKT